MKRIIISIIVLMLCIGMLSSCDQLSGIISGGNTDGEQGGEQNGENNGENDEGNGDENEGENAGEGIEDETDSDLDGAIEYINQLYKGMIGTITKDFDVVAKVNVGDSKFPITWTCDNNAIVIRESVTTGFYTVDIPEDRTGEIGFSITATVSNGDGNSKSKSFGFTLPAPKVGNVLTIPEATELGGAQGTNSYTTDKYYVSGTINNITNNTYGNMVIEDERGNSILIYGTYDYTGSKRYDKMSNAPVVGDSITVYGVVGNYNGDPQLKDAWITAINGVEFKPDDVDPNAPVLTVVEYPKVNTAYKFGMVQGNLENAVYYLAGGMDGYYMATTLSVSSAINVYLEATEGGYYMYTLIEGAKTYINFVISGTHVNGAYEKAASTVYTFDIEKKTVIATVNGETYWLATYDKYDTLGPCKTSYSDNFYGMFYEEYVIDENHVCEFKDATCTAPKTCICGETEGEALSHSFIEHICERCFTEDPTYYWEMTIPEVIAAKDGKLVQIRGIVTMINEDWNTTFNNVTVTISDENGNTLYIYRLSTNVSVGDMVTIKGVVDTYNGAKQIAQGATAEITGAHVCSDYYEATCTEPKTCKVCGEIVGEALDHNDTDGDNLCDNDGCDVDVTIKTYESEISFATTANRTELSTSKQVWEQNGITVTNEKGSSTTNIADYSSPARFYKSSTLIIACKGMTKIVIDCTGISDNKYITAWDLVIDGAKVTVDTASKTVTIEFEEAVDSLSLIMSVGQCRAQTMTIYGKG